MHKRKWKLIYKSPGYGQRYFVDQIGGRVAMADNSGDTPDTTDDGVLWIVPDRPWEVGDKSWYCRVIAERDGKMYSAGEYNDALPGLLKALHSEAALKIVCEAGEGSGVAAKAIVKCLSLGVDF